MRCELADIFGNVAGDLAMVLFLECLDIREHGQIVSQCLMKKEEKDLLPVGIKDMGKNGRAILPDINGPVDVIFFHGNQLHIGDIIVKKDGICVTVGDEDMPVAFWDQEAKSLVEVYFQSGDACFAGNRTDFVTMESFEYSF